MKLRVILLLIAVFVEATRQMATEIVAPITSELVTVAQPVTAGDVANLPKSQQPLKDQTLADTANLFSRMKYHKKPAQEQFIRAMQAAGLPNVGVMKRQIEKLDEALEQIRQISDPVKKATALDANRDLHAKLVGDLNTLRANIRTASLPELTEVLVANQKVGEETEKVAAGLDELGLLRELGKDTLTAEERERFEAEARKRLKVESKKELVGAEIESEAETGTPKPKKGGLQ